MLIISLLLSRGLLFTGGAAQIGPTTSVTVPFTESAGSSGTIAAMVDGKPAKVALELATSDSVVFSPKSTIGAADTTADVKIGAFDLGRISVGSDLTPYEVTAASGGLVAALGYESFKGYALGFDLRRRTLTLWHSASRDALKMWAAGSGGRSTSIPFEYKLTAPVVIERKIGDSTARIEITTGTGINTLAGKFLDLLKAPGSSAGHLPGPQLVKLGIPDGPSSGWTWCLASADDAESGYDGSLDVRWMDIPRIAIDTVTKTVWLHTPSADEKFATWLTQTVTLPLVSDEDGVALDPDASTDSEHGADSQLDTLRGAVIHSIAGYEVSRLRTAFIGGDAASWQTLVDFARHVVKDGFVIDAELGGRAVEITLRGLDSPLAAGG